MLAQCQIINDGLVAYGGIAGYHKKIRKSITEHKSEKYNPWHGSHALAPEGKIIMDNKEDLSVFDDLEVKGLAAVGSVAFVLCAGGSGKRLGAKGHFKMGLVADVARDEPILKHYIEHILALQVCARKGIKDRRERQHMILPLVIMTSDENHQLIEEQLKANENFGMAASQITLLMQTRVFSVKDHDAAFQVGAKDQYHLELHAHGPGAVHALIEQSGVTEQWSKRGINQIVFFHDNNLLGLHGVLAALGVSIEQKWDINHICIGRKDDKQADPLVVWYNKKKNIKTTAVVPYQVVEEVFKNGKVKAQTNEDGTSKFPQVTHTMLVEMKAYQGFLAEHKGVVHEYIFATWKDRKKGILKVHTGLDTRLESVVVPETKEETKVGFTQLPDWICWAPFINGYEEGKHAVKDKQPVHSMGTAEHALFYYHRRILAQVGAAVDVEGKDHEKFGGLPVPRMGAKVILDPTFGPTQAMMRSKFETSGDNKVAIGVKSTLVLSGQSIRVMGLQLDGTLLLSASPKSNVTIDHLQVKNKGWDLVKIPDKKRKRSKLDQKYMIRGYHITRDETKALQVSYESKGVFDLFQQTQMGMPVKEPGEEGEDEKEGDENEGEKKEAKELPSTPNEGGGDGSRVSSRPNTGKLPTSSRTPREGKRNRKTR